MKWKVIAIGLAVALAAVVICAVPLKTVSYVVSVPYQDIEAVYIEEEYTVSEPYTKIETYTEKEPYDKSVPINYIVTDEESYNWFWGGTGANVWIKIRNADVESGYFYVEFHLMIAGDGTETKTASRYIAVGQEEKVQVLYRDGYVSSFTYSITPPTKTVTEVRDVQKTREVVDYRDVTRYRCVPEEHPVIKIREETRYKKVPIREYLITYR